MTETMTLKTAFLRNKKLLARPGWAEHVHIELQTVYTTAGKAGGVRFGGRLQLSGSVIKRDEGGEKKVPKSSVGDDGWIEWEPPADVAERAKEFGWETYKER